jgi:hypothetical protein
MSAPFDSFGAERSRSWQKVGVFTLIVLALALRAWRLQGQSLSSDEIVEASVARLAPAQIISYRDGFPPLYHLLLAGWTRISPLPESGRWLSVIAGVATVYLVYRWTRQEVSELAGVFAGGLAALSPLLIYFSQELRAYSLYICLATASLMFFFEAVRTNSRRSWTAFVVASALSMYTHYYAALTAGLLGLLLIYYRPRWHDLKRGLTSFVALACCSMPVLLLLPGDVEYQIDGFAAKAPQIATLGHTGYALFAGFSLGPSMGELHHFGLREAAQMAAPWVAIFAPAALWLMVCGWQELRKRSTGGGIIFLAIASAPAIAAAGALADVGPKVRYWCWIAAPLLLWLGAGTARNWNGRGQWLTRCAFAALAGVSLIAISNRNENARYANEDIRGVCDYLEQASDKSAPVFVVSDYMAPPVRYYLNGADTLDNWLPYVEARSAKPGALANYLTVQPWSIHPRTEADVRGSAPLDEAALDRWLEELKTMVGTSGQFWLIYTRPFHGDPNGKLLHYLQGRRWISPERQFSGAELYRGKLSVNE